METLIETILNFLLPFIESHPIFSAIVFFMGFLRAVFKPLMALIEVIVSQTPTPQDDELYEDFKQSKVYSTIIFILDWFASIKTGALKKLFR